MPESLRSPVLHPPASGKAPVPSCAVIVMSCDAYRDLWRPFFTLFWRYWPDCLFPVYLGTNRLKYDDSRVTTLPAGDHEWSKRLRLCLEQIDEEYVLLLLEDYFLESSVSNVRIIRHLKLLHALGGSVLRLYPLPGPDLEVPGQSSIGRIHRLAAYRISTQAAIWARGELLRMLRDGESIWEFERQGTERSQQQLNGFYATYDAVLPYRQVVERGKWFPSAARHYAAQQIGCDFEARPVIGPLTALKKAINRGRKNSIGALWRLRFHSALWQ
jgi:hypothetical protein